MLYDCSSLPPPAQVLPLQILRLLLTQNCNLLPSSRLRKTALQLCGVDLVKEGGLTQTLRLDTVYSELLMLFAGSADGFRTVCQSDEGHKGESNCHHPFDSEDSCVR